jgi:hypothetical protein
MFDDGDLDGCASEQRASQMTVFCQLAVPPLCQFGYRSRFFEHDLVRVQETR